MPQPVALRLSRNSQPYWLTHLAQPQSSPLRPLLLLPGGGGQGVQVEDSLIFAASPLLQRALSSHGTYSSTAIVLPFVTSSTLVNFVALLRQGRVTIGKEDLPDLEAIFSVLEIKIATSIGEVCETSTFSKGEFALLKTKDVKQVEGAKSNQEDNQPDCATPSVAHARKTPSLLHTMLSSPAKRPAITPPKNEPTDESKRRRTCTTTPPSSAPAKPPLPHVPEVPVSPIEANNQQVQSSKETMGKGFTKTAPDQGGTPKLAGSEADMSMSAPGQAEQASAAGSVSIIA